MLSIIYLKGKHYDSHVTPMPHTCNNPGQMPLNNNSYSLCILPVYLAADQPPPHSPPRATGWATLTPSPWCPRSSLWSRSLQGIRKLQRRLRKTLSGLEL